MALAQTVSVSTLMLLDRLPITSAFHTCTCTVRVRMMWDVEQKTEGPALSCAKDKRSVMRHNHHSY